jgi:hypothetical protein
MRLLDFLYWSEAVEYSSEFPMPETITRLKGLVHTGFIPRAGVNGRVSERRVHLYRVIPFWANSFAPFFVGKLKSLNGGVVLSGTFSMNFAVKVFMTVWFLITLVGSVGVLVAAAAGSAMLPGNAAFLVIPFGLFAFGIVLVKTGQWFSRGDVAYISSVIRRAFGKDIDNHGLQRIAYRSR